MALWAIARRAKRPGGYQPKRGLATAVARTTIEVAGLRPSDTSQGFINSLSTKGPFCPAMETGIETASSVHTCMEGGGFW